MEITCSNCSNKVKLDKRRLASKMAINHQSYCVPLYTNLLKRFFKCLNHRGLDMGKQMDGRGKKEWIILEKWFEFIRVELHSKLVYSGQFF